MKEIVFHGTSRCDLKDFSPEARRAAGYQLDRVQAGLEPSDWKPMMNIGAGVKENQVIAYGWYLTAADHGNPLRVFQR